MSTTPTIPDEAQAATRRAPLISTIAWLWLRRGPLLLGACVAAALVHPVATALSRYSWTADLFSHFLELALLATGLAVAVAMCAGRHRLALGLVVLAAWQSATLGDSFRPNPVRPASDEMRPLRVLMINVLFENNRCDQIADLIEREQPDVVGMVEFTRECSIALSRLHDRYPYRVEWPDGASGLALWFRERPIRLELPELLVPRRNPVLHATFEYAGRPRELWLVHPTSPMWRTWLPGNPEVAAIARVVGRQPGSRIVVGDMNTTDGSPFFGDFLRTSGLRDSRLGFGRQGSWPSNFPYRIAIDHAFVSDDLAVVDRRLGPQVGSDHLPLIVDLAPAASDPSSVAHHASGSTAPR